MEQPPKAPTGLRAPGKRLWVAVADKYLLTPAEMSVLGEACRTSDKLTAGTRRRFLTSPPPGCTGQLKPHPLLEEVRRHRTLLERLTTALALPDEDQTVAAWGVAACTEGGEGPYRNICPAATLPATPHPLVEFVKINRTGQHQQPGRYQFLTSPHTASEPAARDDSGALGAEVITALRGLAEMIN